MLKSVSLFFFLFTILSSCSSQDLYCVDVDYYNQKTGTQSSYRLTAEVESGQLIELNFPSGGHIDEQDFGIVYFENETAFANIGGGKTYKIKLLKKGGNCFEDVPKSRQCKGTTKEGDRCKIQTDNSDGYCWKHPKIIN